MARVFYPYSFSTGEPFLRQSDGVKCDVLCRPTNYLVKWILKNANGYFSSQACRNDTCEIQNYC